MVKEKNKIEKNKEEKNKKIGIGFFLVLLVFAVTFVIYAFSIISYDEYGLQKELGVLYPKIYESGIHYVGIGTLIRVNNQIRNYEITIDGASSDFQDVEVIFNLNIKIKKDEIYNFVKDYPTEEKYTQYLNNKVEEKVKQTLLKYSAEKMLLNRSELRKEMLEEVKSIPELKYFEFNDLTIKNIKFSEEFNSMLERRAGVEQERVIIEKQKKNLELLKRNIQSVNIDTYFKYKLIEKWDGKADLIISDAILTTGKN